ncbi:hypothetical protein P10VF_039 [Rhizobium phage vB_RleM_P10VF]|uniref:Uncharacterized protein n=2 Tax=Innesvirus TaxID=3044739 RepID=A0A076YKG9_9CAUD|nr:hypothetical protein P10VF_039 [Rhizobium phage vB_RleM_P10VF]YP_010662222.1 hypothetical protein PP938_gp072 [Rhizobium phage AF3]AIK68252.1 hypothetical protein P10VF_039 [Rhizobium phage vB_RleM_P10VF]QNH71440.1 hypothetical protein AF3_072 [Rhizobium phage AF3]
MNMVVSMSNNSFATGKIDFEKYSVSWVRGGRIKVENLITKLISFYDYSAHTLKSVIELCEEKVRSEDDLIYITFSAAACDIIGEEHIELLHDETACFLIPRKLSDSGTIRLRTKGEGRNDKQISISAKKWKLQSSARYILQDDGELVFFEEITPENFGKHYDDTIINVYRGKPRKK